MKLLSTIALLLLFSFQLSAQFGGFGGKKGPSIKGKITGKIVDPGTSLPVSYATISLFKMGSDKIINGVLSEEDGSFKFSDIKDGKYALEISFLGYETKKIDEVILTLKDPDYSVGEVSLSPDNIVLDAVEIKGKRALIENKVDKIVFNAEDDSSIAGGDATDVLRKVPLLSVDLDGNVSLRGSQQVQILINGKPSGMFSSNAADALKMFPADQIKKVEVITAPGAKYDGEGSGGIINIITKKENVEGVAGTINASAGNIQNSANLNLNIGQGRFGFSANGGAFYSIPNDAKNSFTRTLQPSEIVSFSRTGITNQSRLGFRGSASAFYDFNAFNALNTSVNVRGFAFDRDGTSEWFALADDLVSQSNFTGTSVGSSLNSGIDWNTDFTKKFADNEKRELVFAVQLSTSIQTQDNVVRDESVNENFVLRDEKIFNDPDNLEVTAQIDYVHPVGESNKLEVGVKTVIRNIDSSSEFFLRNTVSGAYDIVDADRTDNFLYDQDVYAAYASYNFFVAKLNAVIGARIERTIIDGDGDIQEQIFQNSYTNLLPNIAVSKTLSNFRTLKLSYSERIQRPSLRYVNPFVNTTDIGNTSFGNPFLDPELTKQVELGYNTNFLGISIFGSLFYRNTTALIESIVIDKAINRSQTTYNNVGRNNSIGVNIFTSKTVGKVTLRGGGDVNTYNGTGIIDGEERSNSALAFQLFTSAELSFSSSIKGDFTGIFSSPRFTLQGQNPSFSLLIFGVRKDFKNSSIGIRVVEPWSQFKDFDADIVGNGFRQESSFSIPFRSFGLTYRYKFGKVNFKERRSKIKNTDLKSGEGGNDGSGGQQQGGRGN